MINSYGMCHFDNEEILIGSQNSQQRSNEQDLNYAVTFGKFEEQMSIHQQLVQLAKSNQMKTEALEKASQMIILLEEQLEDIKKENSQLKQQLYNKKVKIQYLEQKIETITSSNQQPAIETSMKSSFPGSKIEALTGSKLFFSFSQPQKQHPEGCTFTPPTFELDSDLLISQQLPHWQEPQGIIAGLKQVLSKQSSSESALRQIQTLVQDERIDSETLKLQVGDKLENIQELVQYDFSSSQEQVKSSSTETQRQKDYLQINLLQQYEKIILEYKSYAARLKAQLCQAINAISYLTYTLARALPEEIVTISKIPYFISNLLLNYRTSQAENKQLRFIIEGLIQNLKLLRKEYLMQK